MRQQQANTSSSIQDSSAVDFIPQLDSGAVAGARVQCVSSTDFVVGKQTNFNGPVTIINYPTPDVDGPKENVVIRDEVLTTRATKVLEQEAQKETQNGVSSGVDKTMYNRKLAVYLKESSLKTFYGLPAIIWVVLGLILACLVIGAIIQVTRGTSVTPPLTDIDGEGNGRSYIGNESHLLFKKKDWGGLAASSRLDIDEPVPYVIVSHTAGNFCYEKETCMSRVRNMQKDHMSRNPPFADIAFNFLIGGDGYIYVGRDWSTRSPHTGFVNNKNIDITFIGDFSVYDSPTLTQVDALRQILVYGVEHCLLHKNYSLIAHNGTEATLSPGRNLYAIISKWKHFDPNPKAHPDQIFEEYHCKSKPQPLSYNATDTRRPFSDASRQPMWPRSRRRSGRRRKFHGSGKFGRRHYRRGHG